MMTTDCLVSSTSYRTRKSRPAQTRSCSDFPATTSYPRGRGFSWSSKIVRITRTKVSSSRSSNSFLAERLNWRRTTTPPNQSQPRLDLVEEVLLGLVAPLREQLSIRIGCPEFFKHLAGSLFEQLVERTIEPSCRDLQLAQDILVERCRQSFASQRSPFMRQVNP